MKTDIFETISPDFLLDETVAKLTELENTRTMILKTLPFAPKTQLHVRKRKENFQYYESQNKKRVYIKKENQQKIRELCQTRYDKKVLNLLNTQINVLRQFIKNYHPEKLNEIYKNLHEGVKRNVDPVFFPDELYCEKWNSNNNNYKKLNFEETAPELISKNGTRVRSKSEMMIADALYTNGIPFKYEVPFNSNGITLHPDFLCLNKKLHKEIYWEHFGLLDDEDYFENIIKKTELYQRAGLKSGSNIIFSMESKKQPLTSSKINKMIELYLE